MSIGASGAHFRGNPNCLHQFLLQGAMPQRRLCMALDAIRTLSDMRDRNSDDLLHSCRKRAIGENFPTERLKGLLCVWGQFATLLRKLSCR